MIELLWTFLLIGALVDMGLILFYPIEKNVLQPLSIRLSVALGRRIEIPPFFFIVIDFCVLGLLWISGWAFGFF